jgi:hypothetical protein
MEVPRLKNAFDTLSCLYVWHPPARKAITDRLDRLIRELSRLGQIPNVAWEPRNAVAQERKRIIARLGTFCGKTSKAWEGITKRFGDHLNHTELLSIAQVVGWLIGINVDREAKRRKEILIKWFDDHWPIVSVVLEQTRLEDSNGLPVVALEVTF